MVIVTIVMDGDAIAVNVLVKVMMVTMIVNGALSGDGDVMAIIVGDCSHIVVVS